MKRVVQSLAATAILFASASGSAASVYVLDRVEYWNFFAGPFVVGTDINGSCPGCGVSTATLNGSAVDVLGASWSVNDFGQNYNIFFDATTTVGLGVTLTKDSATDSCNDFVGTVCSPASNRSGLGGLTYYTGFAADGTTPDALSYLHVWADPAEIWIQIGKRLSETSNFNQEYALVYNYSHEAVVPIPAAAWLFVSGLGVLATWRRRVQG